MVKSKAVASPSSPSSATSSAIANRPLSFHPANTPIQRVNYEVFGKVQGVFFRKHTLAKALELGLKGYVQNTDRGTVIGVVEGPTALVRDFVSWISTRGSPKSEIKDVQLKVDDNCTGLTYREFSIKK